MVTLNIGSVQCAVSSVLTTELMMARQTTKNPIKIMISMFISVVMNLAVIVPA